jgi:Leucine-rich repeat (LRR) protein
MLRINMVRCIAFSLLLGAVVDASIHMRPVLLRRLDTSIAQDQLRGPIMIHQTQQNALYHFFLSTEMNSELSLPHHNWRFLEGTKFSTLHYCNFTGVGCDKDLFVSSLDLIETMLAGTLPHSMGNLSRLVRFRAFNNTIEGSIPQSLAQISGLRNLNIGHNSLSGILPDFSGSSLQRLILDRNSFTGTVPETLCNLNELSALDLSGSTKLFGSLPSCLGDLTFLSKLRITDSGLTGSVPTNLCNERLMNVRLPPLLNK